MDGAIAILLGAGSGDRLGAEGPKAFVDIEGMTLLQWGARAARGAPGVGRIVAVVPAGWEERAISELGDAVVVAGGPTRQASVHAALSAIAGDVPDDAIVLCHDAARPLASSALFASVAAAVEDDGGVVPVIPVSDTLKRVEDHRVVETVSRDGLVLSQTPQAFRSGVLRDAHVRALHEGEAFTDDAALLEWDGGTIRTVPGEPQNLKITTHADLDLARAIARGG